MTGLTTSLVFTLAATPSSSAFTITPRQPGASSFYRYSQRYRFPDGRQGITELNAWPFYDPRSIFFAGQVREIKRGGTEGFMQTLTDTFPNWNFSSATSDLSGSFDIEHYFACAPQTNCGAGGFPAIQGGVGAFFRLNYQPKDNDPTGNQVHWIQRVRSNYNPIEDGVFTDIIDIPTGMTQNPYYDTYYAAGTDYFLDRPYNPNVEENHYFFAELYLVEEIAPQTVKIYNGIRWGWKNQVSGKKQNPNPACPPGSQHSLGGSGGGGVLVSDSGESECVVTKKFSDSLSSGTERDNFYLDGLTPGATFHAWTNNDLPSNQCNPNTYLSGYNDDGRFLGADDNSSHVGNGFASSVLGTVSSNGTINLSVSAADGGRRGEDEGNYELYVNVYDAEDFPLNTGSQENNSGSVIVGGSGGGGIIVGGSGGGGIIVGNEDGGDVEDTPGRTQQNPILPSSIDSDGWQTFSNVPGCRWYDPPIEKGFEFVATDNTLFTEILDFPVGEDDLFTVMVDDMILGEFSPGDRVDFVSLLGAGVSRFKVTDIDYFIGDTVETYFPIQLAFDKNVGSFKMRPIVTEEETPKKTPESNSIWGLIVLCAFGVWKIIGLRNRK
ncbi:hypothetical protein [Okeania sp. KiyG1]|uniref:hypothetical protein n=1 Tax=Okeania sp. KiyG1 TaxID=2720165 RepID=UPI001F302D94|nr:hypothetical protein [Okeania sp. KiyG1]